VRVIGDILVFIFTRELFPLLFSSPDLLRRERERERAAGWASGSWPRSSYQTVFPVLYGCLGEPLGNTFSCIMFS